MDADVIILAGGRSSRLGGVSKATLTIHGSSLLQRTVDAVPDARRVVIVAPSSIVATLRADARVIAAREDPPFAGPAAAIAAGCDALRADGTARGSLAPYVWVLACDMPRIASAIGALSDAAEKQLGDQPAAPGPEFDGFVGVDGSGRRQQLIGAYRSSSLFTAVDRLRQDGEGLVDASVRRLFEALRLTEIQIPADAEADVDTWADAEMFGATAAKRPAHEEVSA